MPHSSSLPTPGGAAAQIPPGTQLSRIGSASGHLDLLGSDPRPEPDTRFVQLASFRNFLDRQTALAAILAADEVCVEAPLSPLIAQRLLRAFGGAGEAADDGATKLSKRERETLILIARGLRLPEVATPLGVSRNTARDCRDDALPL